MQHPIRFSPTLEATHDGSDQFAESGEVVVVRGESSGELPDALDRSQLRAVRRQEQQGQEVPDALQERTQLTGVVITALSSTTTMRLPRRR